MHGHAVRARYRIRLDCEVGVTTRLLRAFGPGARDQSAAATTPGFDGAVAALETFYRAFNTCDLILLSSIWTLDELAQLNNPIGGVVRGNPAVTAVYRRIFDDRIRVQVTLEDVVAFTEGDTVIFTGRERGSCVVETGERLDLAIRTTRCFRYETGAWKQFHHHGSIDDPDVLAS